MRLVLRQRLEASERVVERSLRVFGPSGMALAWTGGKDSTVMVWLYRQVCARLGLSVPCCVFIDEGDVFEEIWAFLERLKALWGLQVEVVRNDDVLGKVRAVGDRVRVAELSELNRRELQALSCGEEFFVFEPDSVAGNHLLKTVPLKEFIRRRGLKALATAIRWDEQPARAEERYFSPRQQPQHMRVQPLLHFTERDIWSIIHTFGIPYCSLYEQGYRSLGPRSSTKRFSELPAWLQDLTQSPERQGRGQDKEAAMQRLRSLGYM